MKLLYGTNNTAKFDSMKKMLQPLNIQLIGLKDLEGDIPCIAESGSNPLENATIKATTFYKHFHIPVFSCDSGLFFENIEPALQPGTHVRRINQRELNDEEMIEYYSLLAHNNGGEIVAQYKNAICFIFDDNHIFKSMDNSLSGSRFLLVEQVHPKRVPGFPLDSLSKEISTHKYFFDINKESVESSSIEEGIQKFFSSSLKSIMIDSK